MGVRKEVAGWQLLVAAASGPSEVDLLHELLQRATAPVATVQDLIPLLTSSSEADTLSAIVGRAKSAFEATGGDRYARHKARMAAKQRQLSMEGREIGPLPPVKDPERKEACQRDLRLALTTYFPRAFPLRFSDNHLLCIKKAQLVVLVGALFALAMPRGTGKTTVCQRTAIWAVINGHRHFVVLLGATEEKGQLSLQVIDFEIERNDLLLEDFPEVCYPFRKLEGQHNRSKGQLLDGQPTGIKYGKKTLVLPTVAGSLASGSLFYAGGLMTAVRGAQHILPDGRIIRPDLVLLDDIQTRESAESPPQSATRERIVAADILGLAGPGESIAALMPITVIARGDTAENILNRERHPEWRGERTRLLEQFPDDMELWEDYNEIRKKYLQEDDEALACPRQATEFYRKHRRAMDKGAVVTWPERFGADEISGLQYAMNLFFRDEAAFWSEYQNEPKDLLDDDQFLGEDELAIKVSGYERRVIPEGVEYLTSFVDVHKRALYWMVCGWEPNFTGFILDYGVFPKQNRPTFTVRTARPTIQETYRGVGLEAAVYKALCDLHDHLWAVEWEREDGQAMAICKALVDCGWGQTEQTVKKFCREWSLQRMPGLVMPSRGRYIKSAQIPISQFKRRAGELLGEEWIAKRVGKIGREVQFDTYHWKTFFHRRYATDIGDPGCLTAYGERLKNGRAKTEHLVLAQHFDSEYRTPDSSGGRPVDIWNLKPSRTENHFFDCGVGNCVAASMAGARIIQTSTAKAQKQILSLSERRAAALSRKGRKAA